eukprot:3150654-Amphidinium_carterae.1
MTSSNFAALYAQCFGTYLKSDGIAILHVIDAVITQDGVIQAPAVTVPSLFYRGTLRPKAFRRVVQLLHGQGSALRNISRTPLGLVLAAISILQDSDGNRPLYNQLTEFIDWLALVIDIYG